MDNGLNVIFMSTMCRMLFVTTSVCITLNPLKCSGVTQLHLKVFSAFQVYPRFLISDIWAL